MSQSTFKILFYLRKNRLNKNGQATIMVRITLSGDISQFSSKLEIEPHLWDTKAGKAAGKSSNAAKMNTLLENVKNALTNHYHQIDERDSSVTVEKIRNAFLGFETRQQTLLELFGKHNQEAAKLVGISKTKATLQKYTCTYNHIERFMKSHYHISDIALKEINHMFIADWETYLRTEGGCSENTTAKFMQFFKRIILIARNNGWIIGDPFANYKIRLKRVDRGYLNEQEIADVCGIEKNLTFHLARHTFATTTTLAKGVPIETVSKMLGHTNIQTTQIYARITNDKISRDMQALSGKLQSIEDIYAQAK